MTVDLRHVVVALRHCGRIRSKLGLGFHSTLIKSGFSTDIFSSNNLISMYVDSGSIGEARKVFDEMPHRNVVTWATMVSAYTSNGKPDKALALFSQMMNCGADEPNGFLFSAVLKACALVGDVELGRLIHERIFRYGLKSDIVLMNALLAMYVKCSNLSDAKRAFDAIKVPNLTSWNTMLLGYSNAGMINDAVRLFYHMPEKDIVSWNSIIAGFANNGNLDALTFLCMMQSEGLKPDEFTVPCVLNVCSCLDLLHMGKQIHTYALKVGIISSCFTASALIDMYSNCNMFNEARKLFDHCSTIVASICNRLALQNAMLYACVASDENESAILVLQQISQSGACLDEYTLSSALKICINLLNFRLGCQVHALILTSGYELDNILGSILIDLHAKIGNTVDAFKLFHRLPQKDIIAWSSLLAACAKAGLDFSAISLFRSMVSLDFEVDQFVISSILKVCSGSASISGGKQMHCLCVKCGFESKGTITTSLVDMYSKCGAIDDSLALFHVMPEKDVVSWTGIIVGCGQNGRGKEAIELFMQMIQSGLKPNGVTFLSVLSACRYDHLVEEAWCIFNYMKSVNGVEPKMEHYSCLVDLLGQAGYFKEAENLIAGMPFKPDKTIWTPMLAACGIHRNSRLVTTIAEQLIASAPQDPSVHVMLSNVYADLGLWESLSKVRKDVKGLSPKEAGMSWIVVSK